MKSTPNASAIIVEIDGWLKIMCDNQNSASHDETDSAIQKAIRLVGYSAPFNQEQNDLIQLLKAHCANKLACLTAWAYYDNFRKKTDGHVKSCAA